MITTRRFWVAQSAALAIAGALMVTGCSGSEPGATSRSTATDGAAAQTATILATAAVPSAISPPASAPASTGLAQSVGLVHVYGVEPELMAATGGSLYGIEIAASGSTADVVRIDPDGTITRRTVTDPLAYYFSRLVAQGSSLYLGTSVIKRFTNAADELLRIDTSTLTVTARTSLPGGVVGRLVSDPRNVWVALADRVLRLDPVSLAVRATYVIPGAVPPPRGSSSITALALGPGGLWATFGDSESSTLYRFDPASLTVLGRTALAGTGQVSGVVADPESVWLTGTDWVQRIDPTRQLAARTSAPDLQAAAAQGGGLVALVDDPPGIEAFVQVDAEGVVVGRSDVGDAGGRLALDGRDVWLPQGLSVAHWTLLVEQP
jgi:hypothetical protein